MEYRKLSELHEWDKNPRTIKAGDFEDLKQMLRINKKEQGNYLFKPLIISEDGIVLGGNMRLRALRELGAEEAWVSVVKAETDEKKMAFALKDNNRSGSTDLDEIANFSGNHPDFDWSMYKIDVADAKRVKDIIDSYKIHAENDKPEIQFSEELLESHNYIVLYFDNEIDWLQLQSLYPLTQVKGLGSRKGYERVGIGRVIKGSLFLSTILK